MTISRAAAIALTSTLSFGGIASAAPATVAFDRAFDGRDDGTQGYYAAAYRIDGKDHRLEVWRDGATRIKRRTDDAIETYLVRSAGSVEWSMTVLDLKRRVRTDIDRTNLLRIGHFTDWFAQAHSLTRPRGAYRLAPLAGGVAGVKPIASCRWYVLEQQDRSSRICWSTAQRVPLVVVDADGKVAWRVTALAAGPFPPRTFAIDDRGYARNDANADIQAD